MDDEAISQGLGRYQVGLSNKDFKELSRVLDDLNTIKSQNRLYSLFPDKGPLRRELYRPHIQFFEASAWARELLFIAANGTGKTVAGGTATAFHATGDYPAWWRGRRFDGPIDCWAASTTFEKTRDNVQFTLLGKPGYEGTGLIPKDKIIQTWKRGGSLPNAIEAITVKHVSGGTSLITLKAYQQEREGFQGGEKHVIWLDEESKYSIYEESIFRTRNVSGLVMVTFTPLAGLSEVVLHFMPGGKMPEEQGPEIASRFVVNATWDDAPHLSKKEKQEMIDACLPHTRDARTKGVPMLGSGAIYPIAEDDITFDDEWLYKEGVGQLPPWMKYANGMDVGWTHATAAVFGAYDPKTDIAYIYRVYKQGRAEPDTHVGAIKSAGDWIPTVCDTSATASSQVDGRRLVDVYAALGLNLFPADKSVEAGLLQVWQRLVSGRLKIARSCVPWFDEFRTYHRDEDGKIVKLNDDLMDCTRYYIMSGLSMAMEPPYEEAYPDEYMYAEQTNTQGRSAWTGY